MTHSLTHWNSTYSLEHQGPVIEATDYQLQHMTRVIFTIFTSTKLYNTKLFTALQLLPSGQGQRQ